MIKDMVIDFETVSIDGKIYTISNPDHLPIELPTYPCKYCVIAGWYDLYGVMVYCCDMSHCIYDEDRY